MSSSKQRGLEKQRPFVSNWAGKHQITSEEFLKAFKKYDTDNNGYIEGTEVDYFLADIMPEKDLNKSDIEALKKFKDELMNGYDRNKDRRIEIFELSKILPTEDNFLLQFRMKCSDLTSIDFMKIWKHYDSDCNGYLEKKEIEDSYVSEEAELSQNREVAFCYDLMSKKKGRRVSSKCLEDFSAEIIKLYDKNNDGKLAIHELQKLMPTEQNYLSKLFEKQKNLTDEEFNQIFDHYDQNKDGCISEHELSALMRDLMLHSKKQAASPANIERMKNNLMKHLDKNKDNKVQRKELSILFTHKKALKIWK